MEQIYMIEMLIDSLSILVSDNESHHDTDMGFIIKVKFGPKREMFFRENQLYNPKRSGDDTVFLDPKDGLRKWNRSFRVGKSFLFPGCADTFLQALVNFPLKIELWTDDEIDRAEMIADGAMVWDSDFFFKLKETMNPYKLHEPLPLKQGATLKLECCCRNIAIVNFILRLSALGPTVTTEFQHLYDGFTDPDLFVFRTNRSPTMIECRKFSGTDPNFCMIGSLYDTVTLDDPDTIPIERIDICTNLRSCGTTTNETCHNRNNERIPREYPIQTIRMGDICGPCGNTNCDLANKIKGYIRTLEAYKKEAKAKNIGEKPSTAKESRICGQCGCVDDTYHRSTCPTHEDKPVCEDRQQKTCSETNPKIAFMTDIIYDGKQREEYKDEVCEDEECEDEQCEEKACCVTNPNIAFMTDVIYDNKQDEGIFKQDYIIYPFHVNYDNTQIINSPPKKGCSCRTPKQKTEEIDFDSKKTETKQIRTMAYSNYNPSVYNVETKADTSKKFCTDIPDEKDRDCKCDPPVPTPPCKAFNCECIIKAEEEDTRKLHKPFCPCYKHRSNCPVTAKNEVEEKGEDKDDVEEPEELPYGLPPIQLGPCPVLGRPCTVPDGFARMYKTAVMPTQPPSWSEAGKVCCSKEFERIKKALQEYVTEHKQDDYRCLNKFYVDTEKRCCDKEQRLLALLGKSCCGAHKMGLQDECNRQFERDASLKKNAEQTNK